MSVSPTTGLGKLSLESMGPMTSLAHHQPPAEAVRGQRVGFEDSDPDLEPDCGSSEDDDFEDESGSDLDELDDHIICSPFTKLLYDISRLPSTETSQNASWAGASEGGGGGDGGDGSGSQSTQQSGSRSRLSMADDGRDADEGNIQDRMREHFRGTRPYRMPSITIEWCNLNKDEGNEFYAFEMKENVPLSIRIGSPTSNYPTPVCTCKNEKPCHHLLWLFDRIAKLTLYGHDQRDPLVVEPDGSIRALGSLFQRIADYRLEFLAHGLHCDVVHPDASQEPNPLRVIETLEVLSSFEGFEHANVDFSNSNIDLSQYFRGCPPRRKLGGRKRNLWDTVEEVLVRSPEVFSLFLNFLSDQDRVRNHYLKLHFRAKRILAELSSYSKSLIDDEVRQARIDRGSDLEVLCNVEWAAQHLSGTVFQIRKQLEARGAGTGPESDCLEQWERKSAAKVLISILKKVVFKFAEDMHGGDTSDDRNLYSRLIGNHDTGFVVDALSLITDQNQYIEDLEAIREETGRLGANPVFDEKLGTIVARMRRSSRLGRPTSLSGPSDGGAAAGGSGGGSIAGSVGPGAGSKRPGSTQDRRAKRVRNRSQQEFL